MSDGRLNVAQRLSAQGAGMTNKEVMQMALDALEILQAWPETPENFKRVQAIEALRAALAQPEPKPVAWKMKGVPAFATSRPNDTDSIKWDALYTAPLQRKEWVGLTDEKVVERSNKEVFSEAFARGVAWAELKLKEKNT